MKGLSPCCRKRGDTTPNGLTARFEAATLRWITMQKGESCLLLVRGIADEWSRTKERKDTKKGSGPGWWPARTLFVFVLVCDARKQQSGRRAALNSENQRGNERN